MYIEVVYNVLISQLRNCITVLFVIRVYIFVVGNNSLELYTLYNKLEVITDQCGAFDLF